MFLHGKFFPKSDEKMIHFQSASLILIRHNSDMGKPLTLNLSSIYSHHDFLYIRTVGHRVKMFCLHLTASYHIFKFAEHSSKLNKESAHKRKSGIAWRK